MMNVFFKHLKPNKRKPKYLTKLDQIPQLTESEKRELQKVTLMFIYFGLMVAKRKAGIAKG